MIAVACPGCKATFETDERRLAKAGMRVRCPTCGGSFHVTPTGTASAFVTANTQPTRPASPAVRPPPTPAVPAATPGDGVDLPAPATAKPIVDLPARPPRPPPPAPPKAAHFSDLDDASADLPAPARAVVDLPARPAAPAVAAAQPASRIDELDLPTAGHAHGIADLPSKSRGADLPAPRRTAAEPFDELDLPASATNAALPAKRVTGRGEMDFGALSSPTERDLPTPAANAALPTPLTNAALPTPAAKPMDLRALDDLAEGGPQNTPLPGASSRVSDPAAMLPTPRVGTDLPTAAGQKLGRVALEKRAVPLTHAGLPSPLNATGLPASAGVTGLPAQGGALPNPSGLAALPSHSTALPAPSGVTAPPTPLRSTGLPALRDDGGFGELDLPIGEPPAMSVDLPEPPGTESRAPAGPVGGRKRGGGTGFGEISLGGDDDADGLDLPQPPGDGDEFDQIPLEKKPKATETGMIETALPPRDHTAAATAQDQGRASAPRATRTAPARTGLYAALAFIAVVVVGGAALSLTPMGAFGTSYIDERLHGAARRAAAARMIASVTHALENDTFGGVRRALHDIDAQIQQTPNDHDLAAFAAYAYYAAIIRFGNESALNARARTLFEHIQGGTLDAHHVAAARLAHELAMAHAGAARAAHDEPLTRDLATLALLDGDDASAALDAAHDGVRLHDTPRAQYMLARALVGADDSAAAIETANTLLSRAPHHAGARLLLGHILGERAETRDHAVALLGEVEAMGPDASNDERTEAAVTIGRIELGRDHVTLARQAFDRALRLDPRSSAALDGSGTILYRQSNFTDALARFQAAKTADRNDVDAHVGIAMASIALNQPGDASNELQPLAVSRPTDPRVHFWLARALLAANQQTAAEREFREALRLDNTNLEAYTTLAALLFSMQRPESAEQVLVDARAHVSDVAAIHRALGEGRSARGDLAGAESELRQAVAARHDDIRSHFLLAQTLRRLFRYDDAQVELEAVARIDPEYPGLLVERGTLAEARGDSQGALTTFRAALDHDPTNVDLSVRVAAALVATGQYAEADQLLARLLTDHPNVAEAHFVLGRARLAQGNTDDAVRFFERAAELDSTRADYRAYAAEANMLRGQFMRALEHANQAISIDRNYARGYWVRGEVRVRQGQAMEALGDAQTAYRLDPNLSEALVTLADADEAMAHVADAITVYRDALARRPNQGEWHARLGRLLSDQGRAAEALVELRRATSLGDPVNPPPAWLAPAHRQLGDLLEDRDRASARREYQRFVELSAPNAPGVNDVRRRLAEP